MHSTPYLVKNVKYNNGIERRRTPFIIGEDEINCLALYVRTNSFVKKCIFSEGRSICLPQHHFNVSYKILDNPAMHKMCDVRGDGLYQVQILILCFRFSGGKLWVLATIFFV